MSEIVVFEPANMYVGAVSVEITEITAENVRLSIRKAGFNGFSIAFDRHGIPVVGERDGAAQRVQNLKRATEWLGREWFEAFQRALKGGALAGLNRLPEDAWNLHLNTGTGTMVRRERVSEYRD